MYGSGMMAKLRESADQKEEDSWSFGQILPLVLLAAPAYSLAKLFGFFLFPRRLGELSLRCESDIGPLTDVGRYL